uniref:Uncharacterized protein n=1 Tax=Glossina pallidipes TaxID=7398 RepID=A0A1B0A7A1_GLOPL
MISANEEFENFVRTNHNKNTSPMKDLTEDVNTTSLNSAVAASNSEPTAMEINSHPSGQNLYVAESARLWKM